MLLAYQSCMLKVGRRFSVMHATEGAWAGPTFAQAKRYESGGKKVRRLSKEKRKEMVESFIKKYQGSNNGNFPSLNLTHKECGGSFYTIREIVRDIIQENRVLGPAKLLEEHDSDQPCKQFPLGTISTEPEVSLSTEDGSPIGSYQHEETNEELFFVSDKVYAQPESHIINGSHIANDIKATNGQGTELLETTKNMENGAVFETKATEMADVIVETFPLPPITRPTSKSDGNFFAVKDLKEPSVEQDVEKPVGPGNDTTLPPGSSVMDGIEEDFIASKQDSGSLDINSVRATTDILLGSSNSCCTENGELNNAQVDKDVDMMSSSSDKEVAEAKVIDAANVTETKGINGTYASAKIMEPTGQKEVTVDNNADVQHSGSSENRSNPTLDRINLESWEVESKTPKKTATNPMVAALKSIIAAFAKLWS